MIPTAFDRLSSVLSAIIFLAVAAGASQSSAAAPLSEKPAGNPAAKEEHPVTIHDVQSIEIAASRAHVFAFVARPENLPLWAKAFRRADAETADFASPEGSVPIRLETIISQEQGTIDWRMTFPDGAVGVAFSRVTPAGANRSVYSFVLMAPPVAQEALEGALEAQKIILAGELKSLKTVIEGR